MKRNALFLLSLVSTLAIIQTTYSVKMTHDQANKILQIIDEGLIKDIVKQQKQITQSLENIFDRVKAQKLIISKNLGVDHSMITGEIKKQDERDIQSIEKNLETSHKDLHATLKSAQTNPNMLNTQKNQAYLKEAAQTIGINLKLIRTIKAGVTVVEKQKYLYFFTSTKNTITMPALMESLEKIAEKMQKQKTHIQTLITENKDAESDDTKNDHNYLTEYVHGMIKKISN